SGTLTADTLEQIGKTLLQETWDGRPVRLLGLAVSNFVETASGQLSLF
ncbi:MAG: DNA polymerase IV, partial [Chloroflexi bacterium]|nr:DNA polymerase IV [Chloroflexota bacterium]